MSGTKIKWGNILIAFGVLGAGIFGGFKACTSGEDSPKDDDAPSPLATFLPKPSASKSEGKGDKGGKGGKLGTKDNPLKINMVEFHGYAAFLAANGGLETTPDSLFGKAGLSVDIDWRNDIPPFGAALAEGYHCNWRTTADWALDQPGLRDVTEPGAKAKQDARAILLLDNTRGADACISADPSIKSIEDLPGKTVVFLQGTPSHAMVVDAINNATLTPRDRKQIKFKEVSPDKGTDEVAAIYAAGDADVACLWDFDLSLAKKARPGSREIYSTAQASDLIYDVLVCDVSVTENPENKDMLTSLVGAAMASADEAEKNPKQALDLLLKVSDGYALLAKNEGVEFVYGLMAGLDWTGAADHVRVFGLNGGTNQYEAVYSRFAEVWRELGLYARPDYLIVKAPDSVDYRFVEGALKTTKVEATPAPVFTAQEREEAKTAGAIITKPIYVTFETGSATLTARAKKVLDTEVAPFIDSNSSAYMLLSGNTDSTGSAAANRRISKARAEAVRDYLVTQWEYDANRFDVRGLGPDAPVCTEAEFAAEGYESLDACRAANRNVGLSILR